jgi:hypothetical protein
MRLAFKHKDFVPPKLSQMHAPLAAACWLVSSSLHLLIHAFASADGVSERVELLQNVRAIVV